jgi:putative ABC transport system permease protein
MNFTRNAVLSLEILAAHKLRTSLSVLGIVVGVASVVLMVSIGQGAEQRIVGQIRAMGTNLIVVSAGQTRIIAGRRKQMSTVTTLLPADAAAIAKECPSVATAAPAAQKKMTAQWEGEAANTNVVGLPPEGFGVRNIQAARGRLFDSEENRGRRRVAILGPTVVENLLGVADPVGLQIRIGRVPFEVIGVAAPKGMDVNGADQDDLIIVPLETAMRRLLNIPYVQTIYVQARDSGRMNKAEEEIAAVLRSRHRLRDKPDDFTTENQTTLLATEREAAQSLTLLVGGVAGVSLLVGGVGILAVMLISIRERIREIGLRRALGARRRDIRNQFLLEAVVLSGAGGTIGVLVGLGASWALSRLGYWDCSLSWLAAATAFGFSAFLGLAFGAYPAIRAARLEPIVALRAE